MPGEMTEEEREHLRSLAAQAKKEIAAEREEALSAVPTPDQEAMFEAVAEQVRGLDDGGYDLPRPPAPDAVSEEGEDTREATQAFIVFKNPKDGRWIATDEIEAILGHFKVDAPDLADIRRATLEVLEDLRTAMVTQSVIESQMSLANQIAQQQESQRVAQNLGDLRNIRTGGKRK